MLYIGNVGGPLPDGEIGLMVAILKATIFNLNGEFKVEGGYVTSF